MKMIVGLGNPGRKYKKTRHNLGFMFVDSLVKDLKERFTLHKDFKAEIAEFIYNKEKIIVIKPQTFMNLSGEAVYLAKQYYDISLEDIIIVYDDLDLPEGKIRIRETGSSGGHKGLKSIIHYLKTEDIKRIRIGIGNNYQSDSSDYVLSKPKGDGAIAIDLALDKAKEMVDYLLTHSFEEFMGQYN